VKGMLLLSGGIDSPVAAKIMQDRGMELVGIHFHLQPFTDKESEEKSIEIAKKLGIKLYIVPFGEQSSEIVKKTNHRYYYILTRRLMWRIAEQIAKRESCDVLVTGENLGQVSSQTLDNMVVTDEAVEMPILRPLLTNDKRETVDLAEEFGTYETSKGPEVCNTLGPNNPITKARLETTLQEENRINMAAMIDKAVQSTTTVSILLKKQKSVAKL